MVRSNSDKHGDAQTPDRRALLQEALEAIDDLQSKLDAADRRRTEPLAIVGLGCRFPGGVESPDSYWQLLRDGVDAVCEVPRDRWDIEQIYDPRPGTPGKTISRWGGFLRRVDEFDPHFFGITPREAVVLDPQQRLLLEVTWEALENAGQAPHRLRGSQTGVFVGITLTEYLSRSYQSLARDEIDAYLGTGNALNAAAGRLSYLLGLHGPSMSIDTACSSSLVALHVACRSLRAGDCDMAIVGGVNALVFPETFIAFSKWGMMSPEGRCKTFDAAADGFVRGEGCGVLLLKRLSDAIDDDDHIRAVVRGTAVNQDGPSSGLTVPHGPAQEAVIRAALSDGGVEPGDVGYVEAHGTGTELGDPIEVEALAAAYGARAQPLEIGSVKTNLGHLESASGIAGVMKVVLSLERAELPPHLHLRELTPKVAWDRLPVIVPTGLRPWPGSGPRIAGVSGFGFSGTNAHVLLEQAPLREPPRSTVALRGAHLLALSAKSENALSALAARYEQRLSQDDCPPLPQVAHVAATGRSHFSNRLAIVATTRSDAAEKLRVAADPNTPVGVRRGHKRDRPRVVFLFTGQGSQYVGMGRGLYETEPVFHDALQQCDAALRDILEHPLLSVMFDSPDSAILDQTAYAQPALFALEFALAELWRSWGIEPVAVMGHSVGEFVAACVAGVFSMSDGLRLIAERGRLMQALPGGGAMAAVFTDEQRVETAIDEGPEGVAIAAVNGPDNVVISGAEEAVEEVLGRLERDGIQARRLQVSHAFHSPLMDPVLEPFEEIASRIAYRSPRIALISNVSGQRATGEECRNAAYWRRHAGSPVQFARAVRELYAQGHRFFLEVGPGPILSGMGRRCVPDDEPGTWLPSLRKGRDDHQQLFDSVAALYVSGVDIDWQGFERGRGRHHVSLPTYPFQRDRFWIDVDERAPHRSRRAAASGSHPLLGRRLHSPALRADVFETTIAADFPAFVSDHRIGGEVVFPATGYLEMAHGAGASVLGTENVVLDEVLLRKPLVLHRGEDVDLQLVVSRGEDSALAFSIHSAVDGAGEDESSAWTLHALGTIRAADDDGTAEPASVETIRDRCGEEISIEAFYRGLRDRSLQFGEGFRGLEELHRGRDEALGRVRLPDSLADEREYALHPALLDACLQTFIATQLSENGDGSADTYLPLGIDRYVVHRRATSSVWSHATLRSGGADGTLVGDIRILDQQGQPIAEVHGFLVRRVSLDILHRDADQRWREWLVTADWESSPLADAPAAVASTPRVGEMLIFADRSGVGHRLAAALRDNGEGCRLVEKLDGHGDFESDDSGYRIDPSRAEHFAQLFEEVAQSSESLRGVVYLWPLDARLRESETVEGLVRAHEIGCSTLLRLVAALTATRWPGPPPRLWLVSRGAQAIHDDESPELGQVPLWGFGQVLAAEHPELHCVRIDLDPDQNESDFEGLRCELSQPGMEGQVGLRGTKRYVARLSRYSSGHRVEGGPGAAVEAVELHNATPGLLDGLALRPLQRRRPGPEEIEIRVHASALNFRDVLNALGMYPGPPQPLGAECTGTVVAVGEAVRRLAPGDEVMAIASGSHATFVTTHARLAVAKPEGLGFEEAATIPNVFLTAEYGLGRIAGMRAGDRVLIHAAAGGVGMAAVQLAQRAGAEVFATAGNARKHEVLASLGVEHVMSSRSTDFAREVMERTDGRGVDIVLNSLAGDFARKSLATLAKEGRFVEMGKRDIMDPAEVARLRPDVSYTVIDLAEDCLRSPGEVGSILERLLEWLQDGSIRPLPYDLFPFKDADDAFRHMAKAQHIGKVVLGHTVAAGVTDDGECRRIDEDATYLVTGGLGGLGLRTGAWLAAQGARHLVLMGRSEPTDEASETIDALRQGGVEVVTVRADVSVEDDVAAALSRIAEEMPPLRGVFHCAAVFDDGAIVQQTWDRFAKVFAPKAHGAWILHRLTRNLDLDHFVLFSSASVLFESPGQANYTAANAFLDALAQARRSEGLAALSIDWGPWDRFGAVSQRALGARFAARGVDLISPESGFAVLEHLLGADRAHVGVAPVEWGRFLQSSANDARALRFLAAFDEGARSAESTTPEATRPEALANLLAAPESRRQRVLVDLVRQRAAKIMGLGSSTHLDVRQPLNELGLDSLMAVELRNLLAAELGLEGVLPATLLFDHPTIAATAEYLAGELMLTEGVAAAPAQEDRGDDDDEIEELRHLSDKEASELLERELRQAQQGTD